MVGEKINIKGLCFHVLVDPRSVLGLVDPKFISVEGNPQDTYRYLGITKGFEKRGIGYMICFAEKNSAGISCSDPRFNYPLLSGSKSLKQYFERIDKHLN